MKTLALYNIKGGVGKTASCVNLASLAAADGYRTLICDLDPQGSTSYYFRVRPIDKFTRKKLKQGTEAFERQIKGTDYENLDLLPASMSFRNLDLMLDDMKKSQSRLRAILRPLSEEYDLIFLDCPPNITLLSENIFDASDRVIVPVIPTTLSILTYRKLLDFFRENKVSRRKLMAFFSMVERRKKLHRDIMTEYSRNKRFLEPFIPYSSVIERMGLYREPVVRVFPKTAASRSYSALWEVIQGITTG